MASSSGTKNDAGPPRQFSRRMTRAPTLVDGEEGTSAVDSELVPSSLASIAPFLRVANEIEQENRRVAYISIIAFMPTGWTFIIISQACGPCLKRTKIWDSVKELSRVYECIMGLLIFTPIAVLSWFPVVSEFKTRLLFNQAFSWGLQISMILAGIKEKDA